MLIRALIKRGVPWLKRLEDMIAAKHTVGCEVAGFSIDMTYIHAGSRQKHSGTEGTQDLVALINTLSVDEAHAITLFVDWAKANDCCYVRGKKRPVWASI